MATLDLNTSPKVSVYRTLIRIIRNDPTIKRIISRPGSFRDWSSKPQDSEPFNINLAPALRFTPTQGPEDWQFPCGMVGTLYIDVDMLINGNDVDDVMNLWFAIERAIYPLNSTTQLANISALQVAGANTGYALFSQPAFDPSPENAFFAARGQIKIDVRLDFTP
jgi:hypothetical protein